MVSRAVRAVAPRWQGRIDTGTLDRHRTQPTTIHLPPELAPNFVKSFDSGCDPNSQLTVGVSFGRNSRSLA